MVCVLVMKFDVFFLDELILVFDLELVGEVEKFIVDVVK